MAAEVAPHPLKLYGRRATFAVLVGFLVAFGASAAYVMSSLMANRDTVRLPTIENLQWAVSQLEREYLRMLLALEHFAAGRDGVSADDVRFRYDILLSRYGVLQNGALADRFGAVEGARQTLDGLEEATLALEPAILGLTRGDVETAREAYDSLKVLEDQIARIGLWTMLFEEGRKNAMLARQEEAYRRLVYFVIGVGVTGIVLIGLMFHSARASAALQRSADLAHRNLRNAIDSLSDGLHVFDRAGRLVLWNERYAEFFSESADAIRYGAPFEEVARTIGERVLAPSAKDGVEAWIEARRALENGTTIDKPIEARRRDGRWIRISEKRTADGEFVGIVTDITNLKERECRLASQSSLLQTTLDNMGEGIAVYDEQLRLVAWNRLYFKLHGLSTELVAEGASLHELLSAQIATESPDLRESELERAVVARIAEIVGSPGAEEVRRKSGGRVVLERHGPMPDGGFVLLCMDITAQAVAEERLRQSEASLANAQRIAGIGNWDADIRTGAVHWSDQVYRIFGLEPQVRTIDARSFLRLVHPGDRRAILDLARAAAAGQRTYAVRHRIIRPDGEERVVRQQGEILCDESGRLARASGVLQDITAEEAAAAALVATERRYQFMVNSLGDVVFATDAELRWSFLNKAWEKLSGDGFEKSFRRPAVESFAFEDRETVGEALAALMRGEQSEVELPASLLGRDGAVKVTIRAYPKQDKEGRIIGTTGLMRRIEVR